MKPSKPILALPGWLAALALCAALTACGGDDSSPAGAQQPAQPSQPSQPGQEPAVTPKLRCAP
ncbi:MULTISPECIES: hypothetical protein [Cupriavidus]|uniref:hypothetical protein n=1 Tax=Cupriavidus TaxID=106589 RepID=UPI00037D2628|nr:MULTISPECIES: hypothetical protein [Cupriavidus]